MARRSLVPDARQQEIIHKEFTVNGSDLAVSVLEGSGMGGGSRCWEVVSTIACCNGDFG